MREAMRLGLVSLTGACAVAGVIAACRHDNAVPSSQATVPVAITSATTQASRAFHTSMRDHAVRAEAMRDAVVRADLDVARREAKRLSALRLEGDVAPSVRGRVDQMKFVVDRLAEARNLHQASTLLGQAALSCGECHATFGGPRVVVGDAPEGRIDVVPRMRRHQWASERLWEGIVAPSDDAWRAGAQGLADAPLAPEALTPGKTPVRALRKLAFSVRELAERAKSAESPTERSAIYGEVMETCFACHELVHDGG